MKYRRVLKVEQEIENRMDALCGERVSALRTDALELSQRIAGKQLSPGRGQPSSISKRHWMVPNVTMSPGMTGYE